MLLDDPDSSLMEQFLLSESFSVEQWFSTILTQRPPNGLTQYLKAHI